MNTPFFLHASCHHNFSCLVCSRAGPKAKLFPESSSSDSWNGRFQHQTECPRLQGKNSTLHNARMSLICRWYICFQMTKKNCWADILQKPGWVAALQTDRRSGRASCLLRGAALNQGGGRSRQAADEVRRQSDDPFRRFMQRYGHSLNPAAQRSAGHQGQHYAVKNRTARWARGSHCWTTYRWWSTKSCTAHLTVNPSRRRWNWKPVEPPWWWLNPSLDNRTAGLWTNKFSFFQQAPVLLLFYCKFLKILW